MTTYNKWIGIGNLTKDPHLTYTSDGNPVCNFIIAINHKYKERDDVLFMPCVVFGKQAESLGEYQKKGNKILVEGRMTERKWEKDGVQHKKMEVLVQNIRYINKPGSTETSSEEETPEGF